MAAQNDNDKASGWLAVFNYPRVKSSLTSILLVAVTAIGTTAVNRGWVSPANALVLETAVVTLIVSVIGGIITYKANQVSPTNLIAAVNSDKTNGVKVVAATAYEPTVTQPIKGPSAS